MKKIIVVGNGLSAWTITNALANENVTIKVIGRKTKSVGAQQLSPNGMIALKNLTNNKAFYQNLNKLTEFKINSIKFKYTKTLKRFNLNEYGLKYHSVSRKKLIFLLKNNVKSNHNIIYLDEECVGITENENNKCQILLANKQVHDADMIIGTDGVNGITRKYVCGRCNIKNKKVYRSISKDIKNFYLSKGVVKINFLKFGHIVSYPFIDGKNKFVNYVFIPNDKYQNDQSILKKLTQICDNLNLNWKESFYSFDEGNIQNISKNNVFLFGEATTTFEPHLAQVGNNILEDGLFIKKYLDKNKLSYEKVFNYLLEKRMGKKRKLKKVANFMGRIFGLNNKLALVRDSVILKLPDKVIYNFFSEIWKNEFDI